MDQLILQKLLNKDQRKSLYDDILKILRKFNGQSNVKYHEFKISDGVIPFMTMGKSETPKYLKIFFAAQHNEYNGLFGIIKFFLELEHNFLDTNLTDQILFFFPLMNPYGFLNPNNINKSGYYLRDGTNLNRYWRQTFVPDYQNNENLSNLPEQVNIVKNILTKYWNDKKISLYIMDFHETSLIGKYLSKLNTELPIDLSSYKFTHWLEEWILENVLEMENTTHYPNPHFIKTGPNSEGLYINPQIDISQVCNELSRFGVDNETKLAFYFTHSSHSKNYVQILAHSVIRSLKDKIWKIKNPLYDHKRQDHGCFVKMSESSDRPNIFSMELESYKQFFNLDEEIRKSKEDADYFSKKLQSINISIELVLETIKKMILLF